MGSSKRAPKPSAASHVTLPVPRRRTTTADRASCSPPTSAAPRC
jgi:hypothetical protein